MLDTQAPDSVRLDQWLWAARFFRTRALARQAVDTGKVELAGQRPKAARAIRAGEALRIPGIRDDRIEHRVAPQPPCGVGDGFRVEQRLRHIHAGQAHLSAHAMQARSRPLPPLVRQPAL